MPSNQVIERPQKEMEKKSLQRQLRDQGISEQEGAVGIRSLGWVLTQERDEAQTVFPYLVFGCESLTGQRLSRAGDTVSHTYLMPSMPTSGHDRC